jgi:hypothetical protein
LLQEFSWEETLELSWFNENCYSTTISLQPINGWIATLDGMANYQVDYRLKTYNDKLAFKGYLYPDIWASCYRCGRLLAFLCSKCKEIPEECKCDKYGGRQEKDEKEDTTIIVVASNTGDELRKVGSKGETYEDIILRLIRSYEANSEEYLAPRQFDEG